MKKIILASTSPQRKELLSKLNIPFMIVAPKYEEDMTLNLPPIELAKTLSYGKAKSITDNYPDAIIISADSFVIFNNQPMGKPKSKQQAKEMLKQLSGKKHIIITGLTVIDTTRNIIISESNESTVYFRQLTNSEIDKYIKTKEPLDKAGAYAIQGLGSIFIEKFEGDFFGAVGLPLKRLCEILSELKIKVL